MLLWALACLLLLAPANAKKPCGRDGGSFRQPPARARPFFRYWLPDASVDGSVLAEDIASAGAVGAGGIELVPFYQYGLYAGRYPPGADWTTYGFGTPAYNSLFKRALEAHKDAGLVMDFAIGPNQGQGVPAHPDDEGLQWDLVSLLRTRPRVDVLETERATNWHGMTPVSFCETATSRTDLQRDHPRLGNRQAHRAALRRRRIQGECQHGT
jgi:hypothetical protein